MRIERMMLAVALGAVALAATGSGQTPAAPVRIDHTKDNHWVVSIVLPLAAEGGRLLAAFDFGMTMGFLGPTSNPSDASGFVNDDKTIAAVNHQPASKSSYVHLFLHSADGDLTFVNDVNGRAARLLTGRFAESAKTFLRVESIAGRTVNLQTVDFAGSTEQHTFAVTVDANGSIALAK